MTCSDFTWVTGYQYSVVTRTSMRHFPLTIFSDVSYIGRIYLAFMMTSWNENIFSVTDPLRGEFTGPVEFPTQRPVTRSFDGFFDLRLNGYLRRHRAHYDVIVMWSIICRFMNHCWPHPTRQASVSSYSIWRTVRAYTAILFASP